QGIEAYEMKLSLQRKLGQEQAVVPGLEEAVRRDANNASLQILLAREYRKAGRPLPAEMLYRKLLEIHINPEVYRGLFELYREQGTAGAERILDLLNQAMDRGVGDEKRPPEPSDARRARAMLQVLRQDMGLVKMLLPLAIRRNGASNLAFATRGVLATLAAKTRQLPLAEQLYRSCLEGKGTRGGREAEIYVGLLRVLRLQHKNAEIVKLCQEGLKKAQKTNRVLFHTELCRAHQMLDDPEAGLKSADEAVQEAGKDQLLMCKRIRVDALFQAGKPDKALAECQEMLKEYPAGGELRDVRATMSTLLQAMGRFAEAEDQLQLILRTDPNDATANNDLGYLWADRNQRLPEAEAMIRKALELDRQQRNTGLAAEPDGDQDNAAYVDSLGWLLFRQGKIKEAIQILERASQLAGGDDDPVVWDHLGDAYSRDGNPEKASECWKKATSLYEQGARRKSDARYREIREKMKLVRN
ncbi:MAG: tetratricopeptide repeat protein, partial [Gemmataceae bacterium]